MMTEADLILTDSGGIQEEAPSLGKHVLVLRERTKRPEGTQSGASELIGTDPKRIVDAACKRLTWVTPRSPPPSSATDALQSVS
jgi:UDP-N-acetylglucosamine 2-epimerase (non-hydrolysing)